MMAEHTEVSSNTGLVLLGNAVSHNDMPVLYISQHPCSSLAETLSESEECECVRINRFVTDPLCLCGDPP